MLEQMRRHSQSLIIYLIFGVIIAVFIISFGPQSVGGFALPKSAASWAVKVDGREVSQNDFRYAYLAVGGGSLPPQMAKQQRVRELVMDRLIERELLGKEAERLGFQVSDEEVEDFISQARLMLFGTVQSVPSMQRDGHFDYDLFKRFVQYNGLSPKAYIEEQRRELLAQRVRELIKQGAPVSEDEVKERFIREGNQVNLEYVRFPYRRYEEALEPSPEEVAAYAQANEKKLKDVYEQNKFQYEKVPRELQLRALLVKVPSGASADADKAAESKATALVARVKKGESFANVAKAASEDERSKKRGGLVGWRRQGATTFGSAVEDKVWAAKPGDVVGPVKGSEGYYAVAVEGERSGDLAFDKVKLELADQQLRQDQAKAKAKAAADAALAKAKADLSKTLKTLFPAASDDKAAAATSDTPEAQETGLFSQRGSIVEGIGVAPELAKSVFKLTTEAPFAGPVEVSGSLVFVKLKEKHEADMADWAKRKAEMIDAATEMAGRKVVEEWTLRQCLQDKKSIAVSADALRYEDGQEGPIPYQPCAPRSSMPYGL